MNSLFTHLVLHVIESTFWAVLVLGILQVLRIQDSNTRCWIYRFVILKFCVPTILFAQWLPKNNIYEMAPIVVYATRSVSDFQHQIQMNPQPHIVWSGLMVGSGLIGFGFLLTMWMHRRIFREISPFDEREAAVLKRLQAPPAVSSRCRTLRGYLVKAGPSIGLYGLFRPRIIAKREFLRMLTQEELSSALRHEIEHWKQHDQLWRFVVEWVTCCFWFHPLIWFVRKQLMLETEKRCDETVLNLGAGSVTYASCLLKAAEFNQHWHACGGAVALSETSLKQRVSNVIHYQKRKVNRMKQVAIAAVAATTLLGSFMVFASESNPTSIAETQRTYDLADLDERPVVKTQPAPTYPAELKKEGINGRVVIVFTLNSEGVVEAAEVEQTTDERFNSSAVDALKQWTFSPGIKDGKPVKVRVRAPLVFKTRNEVSGNPADYEKLKNSTDPMDIAFLKAWEPKWKAVQQLRKETWESQEDGDAWHTLANETFSEFREYLSSKEANL